MEVKINLTVMITVYVYMYCNSFLKGRARLTKLCNNVTAYTAITKAIYLKNI